MENGRHAIGQWDEGVSYNCWLHNLAMAKSRNVYHAPSFYLNGWSECVAMGSMFRHEIKPVIEYLIFGVLGQSEEHKQIILNAHTLAGSIVIDNYIAYLTVRAK